MSINLEKYKNNLLFIPLGGANEIGINVNLYHYKGKWIMVDCGSGFADDHLPGVDMVVADLSFIEKHKDKLLGLILTHAHEDHLGAIQYLWNEIGCPIYATKFTKCFLKMKLSEYSFAKKIKLIEVDQKGSFDLGPFNIEMVGLTHSAPEMQALVIRTEAGNVVHTGDWKFDPNPLVGEQSNYEALKKVGDEGVLALACDSTNVFNEGVSGSEGDVRESLVKIISGCPKMVVVTTFASNLARLDSLIYAGKRTGRKVCLLGRSMHRMFAAAQESGYLQDAEGIIDDRSIAKYKREELLVIATGCQGEPMAATAKLAAGTHNSLTLAPKDTVIFSSKIIPGNDKKIFQLFNTFAKKKVEVITERDHFVHVSGHPAIEELKKMYELVRPEVCVPVHGEPIHIHEQAKLAKSCGIKQAVEVENGSVVLLQKEGKSEIIGRVENGYLAVDGNYLLPDDSSIFKFRRRMRESGIVVATLILDNKYGMLSRPIINVPGLLDPVEDSGVLQEFSNEIVREYDEMHHKSNDMSHEKIESFIKKILKRVIKAEINKTPMILVNIQQV